MRANHVKKKFVIEKVPRHTKTDAVPVMTMHPYTSSFDLISGLNHAWPAAPHLHSQGREVYVRPEVLFLLCVPNWDHVRHGIWHPVRYINWSLCICVYVHSYVRVCVSE